MTPIEKAKDIASKFKLGGVFALAYLEIVDVRYAMMEDAFEVWMQMTVPHRDTGKPGPINCRSIFYMPPHINDWKEPSLIPEKPKRGLTEGFWNSYRMFLADAAMKMVVHEFWESFRYEGKIFNDPHKGDKRP